MNGGVFLHWVTKLILLIAILVMAIFPAYILLVILLLSNQMHWLYPLSTIAVLLFILLALKLFNVVKTSKRKKAFWTIASVAFIISIIPPGFHLYEANISTVSAEVDIYQYEPYANNALATLNIKPTIQLQEPLPVIDGATALYPYYAALAEAIYPEKKYNPYDSEVMVNKTNEAYTNLIEGRVDLIFAGGPSDQQIMVAAAHDIEFELIPIGREAFVFFVHHDNPIDGLTVDDIKSIYSGNITNWQQLGGDNKAIRAFQRPQDSGSQTALQRLMGDTPIMEAPVEDIATGMGGIIQEVSTYKNYPNAIGYTFRYFSNEMVKNKEIKLLTLNGVAPTKENILNDTYPLASEFFIVTTKNRSAQGNELIDWVLSDEGQTLMENAGYVPLVK